MKKRISAVISQSMQLKQRLLEDENFQEKVAAVVDQCVQVLRQQHSIYFCGNGGSAADAQHLAAELSGRFYIDRKPLAAEALHVNSSFITAVANDYHFDTIYARALEAKGKAGDLLFAITTSGNSPNIIKAAQLAKKKQISVVGLTGEGGGKLASYCDILLNIPSVDTPRIQECHILIGHIICELIEDKLFGNDATQD